MTVVHLPSKGLDNIGLRRLYTTEFQTHINCDDTAIISIIVIISIVIIIIIIIIIIRAYIRKLQKRRIFTK